MSTADYSKGRGQCSEGAVAHECLFSWHTEQTLAARPKFASRATRSKSELTRQLVRETLYRETALRSTHSQHESITPHGFVHFTEFSGSTNDENTRKRILLLLWATPTYLSIAVDRRNLHTKDDLLSSWIRTADPYTIRTVTRSEKFKTAWNKTSDKVLIDSNKQ